MSVSDSLWYTYEPEVTTFYDFSKYSFDFTYDNKALNLNDLDKSWLKYDIATFWIYNDDTTIKAELKVVTYIDLLTQVAGVPSFLFIIYKYCLEDFEKFYSDI